MDFRTEGSRGYSETDGTMESRAADVTGAKGFATPALNDDPVPELPMEGPGAPRIRVETGKA